MHSITLKVRILNVVELHGQSITSVQSFLVSDEKTQHEVIQRAETLFKRKAIANGAPKKDFDSEIGFDHYVNGRYFVQLLWSE